MKKLFYILATFLLATALFSCKGKDKTGPAYMLKMRLANGDKFGQDMDMNMETKMKMMGIDMDMKMTMNMGMDMEVLGDTAGLKKIKFTYTRAKMNMSMTGLPEEATPDTKDIMDKTSARIEGKSIYILLNNKNEITDISGFTEMMTDTSGTGAAEKEQVQKMFSKEQMNNMMGLMFNMYPADSVRIGDTWEKETDMGMGPLSMRLKNEYELIDVKGGVATVALKAKYKGAGKMEQKKMAIDLDMDGNQKGTIGVNLSNGYLINADNTMDIKAKAKIMGQTVPYDIHANYKMKGH
jgi:Family of unknown function (DUF6263)